MNIFRLAGDVSHLVAIIILLLKIWRSKSCAGISGKSQVLFAIVFTTRYLDLFTVYISAYNTVMKVVFLALSYATVYLIYMRFRNTYDSENDTFRVEFLLVPVTGLSFLENYAFTPMEVKVSVRNVELPQLKTALKLTRTPLPPDPVDLLHLSGSSGHNATALHDHQDRRGGVHHHPLPVLPRPLQSPLHRQLGVALSHRGLLRPDRGGVRRRADHLLLRFLLPLRHKSASGKRKDDPADAGLKRTPPPQPSTLLCLPRIGI
uniref:KDEL endoplasmic reticulum protein retention receptor 3 n=3 Tax=Haplochromini TaxID=319058 RepID=A0A3Q2W5E6_HAPBU